MKARLDKIREILVYLVIIFLPVMSIINVFGKVKINMALSDAFAALIVVLTIIDYKNFSLKRNFPYWWYFAGLMVLMIISNTLAYFNPDIVSGSVLSALNEFIKFAIAGVYFFIGYNSFRNKDRMVRILRVWTYTALAVSIVGIVVLLNTNLGLAIHPDIPIRALKQRLVGTLTDPNLAAAYFGISFYIILIFICTAIRRSDKYLGIMSLIITTFALVLTQSRSAIIALIISLILFSVINIKSLYRYITIVLLIAFIGYFGVLNLDAIYFDKQITSSLHARMQEVVKGEGEAISRLNLTKSAFMMGKDHFFTGVGRGNYIYNSDQYYKRLGIDTASDYYIGYFSKLIPHNTYLTFFAELGLLGFILFLVLFYRVVIAYFRRNYKYTLRLCMIVFFLVQAIAVNLENFRGIWLILGVLLLHSSSLEISVDVSKHNVSRESRKKLFAINIVLLFISIVVFLNTVPRYTNPVLVDKEMQTQAKIDIRPNEKYVLRYYITTKTQDIKKVSSRISIYGIDKDKKVIKLNQITHYAPNGYGNLVFTPDESVREVRVIVEKAGINNVDVSINNAAVINTHTGEGQMLFADYIYLPDSIEHKLTSLGIINTNIKEDETSLGLFSNKEVANETIDNYTGKESIENFSGDAPINLSGKVLFLGANFNDLGDGHAKLMLKFKCIGKMDIDYNLWIHGQVIDKGILPVKLIEYGFDNWDRTLNGKTSEWLIGETYEQEYDIYAKPGQYNINFGFWNPKWIDGSSYRLDPSINLGFVQLK